MGGTQNPSENADYGLGRVSRPVGHNRRTRGTHREFAQYSEILSGHPAPFREEFELVIMIGVVIEEMLGSDRDS